MKYKTRVQAKIALIGECNLVLSDREFDEQYRVLFHTKHRWTPDAHNYINIIRETVRHCYRTYLSSCYLEIMW